MNFYDKVHELVRCFKETEEYKTYMGLKAEIKKDAKYSTMLKEFKDKQTKMQMAYIESGKMDEIAQKELENTYSLLIQSETVRSFLESEIRLNVLLADMQKIIGEGLKDIVEFE